MKSGDIVVDRYRLEQKLGMGGMGTVWSAQHTQTGRSFALKIMHTTVASNEDSRQRFLKEAKASARIDHPNVIDVLDVGELEDGLLFMAMELLEGLSLSDALRLEPALTVRELFIVLRETCTALAAAHAVGIVHRDVKPANIFLHRDRSSGTIRPKVLDFGVSKFAFLDESNTHTGSLLGSPRYMSPEQARSAAQADARSDVWSVGVILFEALSGSYPHEGDSFSNLVVAIATTPPRSLFDVAPGLPPAIASLVDACLRPRDQRLPSCETLAARFDDLLMTHDLGHTPCVRMKNKKGVPRPHDFLVRSAAEMGWERGSLAGVPSPVAAPPVAPPAPRPPAFTESSAGPTRPMLTIDPRVLDGSGEARTGETGTGETGTGEITRPTQAPTRPVTLRPPPSRPPASRPPPGGPPPAPARSQPSTSPLPAERAAAPRAPAEPAAAPRHAPQRPPSDRARTTPMAQSQQQVAEALAKIAHAHAQATPQLAPLIDEPESTSEATRIHARPPSITHPSNDAATRLITLPDRGAHGPSSHRGAPPYGAHAVHGGHSGHAGAGHAGAGHAGAGHAGSGHAGSGHAGDARDHLVESVANFNVERHRSGGVLHSQAPASHESSDGASPFRRRHAGAAIVAGCIAVLGLVTVLVLVMGRRSGETTQAPPPPALAAAAAAPAPAEPPAPEPAAAESAALEPVAEPAVAEPAAAHPASVPAATASASASASAKPPASAASPPPRVAGPMPSAPWSPPPGGRPPARPPAKGCAKDKIDCLGSGL